jgi:hypothetical protein
VNPKAAPHGSRRTYRRGCKCTTCRAANAAYVQTRRLLLGPDPAELVPTQPVLLRLMELRYQGVGYRQVAKLSGLCFQLVLDIRLGRKTRVRADMATRLLSVPAVLAHGTHVTGWRTWRLIDSLKRDGFTQRRVAFQLGLRGRNLNLHHRHITVRNALRVRLLYARVHEGDDPWSPKRRAE